MERRTGRPGQRAYGLTGRLGTGRAMFLSRTLSFYIGRQFLTWFAVMFFTILAVIVLIDAVELLRRGANRPDATIGIITGMTLLRAPFLGQEALPFAVLFGGKIGRDNV